MASARSLQVLAEPLRRAGPRGVTVQAAKGCTQVSFLSDLTTTCRWVPSLSHFPDGDAGP